MIRLVTAVIGGIDEPAEVPAQSLAYERVFYSEGPDEIEGNDRMKALYYKCSMVEESQEPNDIIVWIDGKVNPISYDFLEQIVLALGTGEIAALRHHERGCIYQEIDHIEHCMRKGNQYLTTRYKDKPIRKQVEAYRYFGYPAKAGLFDCCIIAMRATYSTRLVCASWWRDVYQLGGFDQVALPFYAWQGGVKISAIDFKPASFVYKPHVILK